MKNFRTAEISSDLTSFPINSHSFGQDRGDYIESTDGAHTDESDPGREQPQPKTIVLIDEIILHTLWISTGLCIHRECLLLTSDIL